MDNDSHKIMEAFVYFGNKKHNKDLNSDEGELMTHMKEKGMIDKNANTDTGKYGKHREEEERRLDPSCWKGYHKQGTKMKGGKRVNNCVKSQEEEMPAPTFYQMLERLKNKPSEIKDQEQEKQETLEQEEEDSDLPTRSHEIIAAVMPKDINIKGKRNEDRFFNLAFPYVVKIIFDGNEKRAQRYMYYDEDFNSDLISTYSFYQKHGFPKLRDRDVERINQKLSLGKEEQPEKFKDLLPDSREEYSAKDYADEMAIKGEGEEGRKRKDYVKENERAWLDSFRRTFGKGYKEEMESKGIDPYEFYVDYYGRLYEDDVVRRFVDLYNSNNSDYPVDANKLLLVMHSKRNKPLEGIKSPSR